MTVTLAIDTPTGRAVALDTRTLYPGTWPCQQTLCPGDCPACCSALANPYTPRNTQMLHQEALSLRALLAETGNDSRLHAALTAVIGRLEAGTFRHAEGAAENEAVTWILDALDARLWNAPPGSIDAALGYHDLIDALDEHPTDGDTTLMRNTLLTNPDQLTLY